MNSVISCYYFSHEIIKILFSFESLSDLENVGRPDLRIELDKISFTLPDVLVVAKKVMNQVGLGRIQSPLIHGNVDPSRLRMKGVEIDHDQDEVRQIGGGLSVKKEGIIIHLINAEIPSGVEGRVLSPDLINFCNKFVEVPRFTPVPVFYLVLLGMEIFLLSGEGFIDDSSNAGP